MTAILSPRAGAAVLALAALAAPAMAQTLKPGLWQVSNSMQGAAGSQLAEAQKQMQQAMASMPPEQRKQMEEMMARQGVRMGSPGAGGAMSAQVCMSREMVERNEMPMERADCRATRQQRSGNTLSMAFACSNPPSSGEGQFTFTSPEAYSSKVTVRTTIEGRAETVTMEGSGKWLSSDCGKLKPLGQK